ncbi:hypothetical protein [Paenibacillus elgii]|uniref:hypothetical protein n=1 Tax=Paenibacillus elgii TaxID=189691 RepID=UPI000248CFF7|nr:hypothetical protein [Paenibacillus elgii]
MSDRNTQKYIAGIDLSYDIIKLLEKYDLTVKEAEHTLEKAKEDLPKYARLVLK